MKRIYDWDARQQGRNYSAADLLALKGVRKLVQTTANSTEEAAAARDVGLDLVMGNAHNTAAVRAGAPDMFFTAAVALPDFPTEGDALMRHATRRFGRPEDIAAIAVWLDSDEAGFATGQLFTVDGGMTAASPINPGIY